MIQHTPPNDNPIAPRRILAAGLVSGLLYGWLAFIDLQAHLAIY